MFKNRYGNLANKGQKETYRINRQIRCPEVRLIENDQNIGVIKTIDALSRADILGLDLIEIAPLSTPPVCVLKDYGKFKYELKQKEKEKHKSQKSSDKELVFSPAIDAHDMEVKVKNLRKFLAEDRKVN